jgi:hypothetical protein
VKPLSPIRTLGRVVDIDEAAVSIGVDHDTVTVDAYRFTGPQAEEFARLFIAACWEASAERAIMDPADRA